MFKKTITIFLVIVCFFSLNGCSAALRKKFIRKKEGEKRPTPVFQPKSYESEFTKEQRYINHYTFWKNAHTEVITLLQQEGMNSKKLKIYAFYAADELNQMQKLMPEEQQKQMQPHIEELTSLSEKLQDSAYASSHRHTLTKSLKHIYNEVTKNFSYIKMKGFLR